MQQKRARIGLVMGDASGIGPGIALKTLADAANGRNCIAAVHLAAQGVLDGVVLAPLNKEAMHLAGSRHPDEFGLLTELAGVPRGKVVVKWGDLYRSTVMGHVAFRDILAGLTVCRQFADPRLFPPRAQSASRPRRAQA
jgi:4-hydroxythreonine-4-phosphate dehydrogenase